MVKRLKCLRKHHTLLTTDSGERQFGMKGIDLANAPGAPRFLESTKSLQEFVLVELSIDVLTVEKVFFRNKWPNQSPMLLGNLHTRAI